MIASMDRTGRVAIGIMLLGAIVLAGTAPLSAQGVEPSLRVGEYADELRRATFRLADRSAQDVLGSRGNAPRDLHDALLAQQIHAGAMLLVDMVRNRRPVDEVREVTSALAELSGRGPAYVPSTDLWRDVRDAVAGLERELGYVAAPVPIVPPAERPIVGRVNWRGMVDDRVHLVIRRGAVETRTVSGSPRAPGTSTFTAPMPEAVVDVGVEKKRGRGEVTVLQQPSPVNDYTAVVEIYDGKGGAQEHRLEIFWR